jgi:hypothetical protein
VADPIGSLADPFNQTSLNTAMWTQTLGGAATMSYATTGASIVLPASSTAADVALLVSNSTYAVTGSGTSLHTVTMVSSASHTDAFFGISDNGYLNGNGATYVRFAVENNVLYGQSAAGAAPTTAWTIAYSSTTHAYWKLSDSAGVVTWWTSSDGITWTSQGTASHGLTTVHVAVEIQCYMSESSPGTFKFNKLNSGPLVSRSALLQQAVNRSYTY